MDCETAFRARRGTFVDPTLLDTLSFTLSHECFESFSRANPDLPINWRDYSLSKMYQFLLVTLLDEGDPIDGVPEELTQWLDEALPESSDLWKRLPQLDWKRFFAAYREFPMSEMIASIATYLSEPAPEGPPKQAKKRGAPIKISNRLKEAALAAKEKGGTNRDAARILYHTGEPTPQQVRNVPSTLRHYRRQKLKS